jgi:repressor LexA
VTVSSILTDRQAAVLSFVEQRQAETGICPSHEEIAAHFRWRSTYAVRQHLRLMAQKGVVICSPGKFRAIRVTRSRQILGIPILGRIPAGPLAEGVEEAGEILPVAPDYFGGGALFALRVHGESMKNAGIFDGDLAVMRHQTSVEDGEIAAVQINHEATLKRVFRTAEGLILRAENPAISDRWVTADEQSEVTIGGVCVGLIRKGRARKL